ncbi:unnamed protein product [Dovyalis caffra]|uniref:Uncharacterized protein n=1 Tax=Dovyalis caffra TaxID=77055 RepID=A0AAV1S475_9ROSI|nr:unnamed protein product [Dovyalis caffra]
MENRFRSNFYVLIILVCVSFFGFGSVSCGENRRPKNIEVVVRAKWEGTPILLEVRDIDENFLSNGGTYGKYGDEFRRGEIAVLLKVSVETRKRERVCECFQKLRKIVRCVKEGIVEVIEHRFEVVVVDIDDDEIERFVEFIAGLVMERRIYFCQREPGSSNAAAVLNSHLGMVRGAFVLGIFKFTQHEKGLINLLSFYLEIKDRAAARLGSLLKQL